MVINNDIQYLAVAAILFAIILSVMYFLDKLEGTRRGLHH